MLVMPITCPSAFSSAPPEFPEHLAIHRYTSSATDSAASAPMLVHGSRHGHRWRALRQGPNDPRYEPISSGGTPSPSHVVHRVGLHRQFLETSEWAGFMRAAGL